MQRVALRRCYTPLNTCPPPPGTGSQPELDGVRADIPRLHDARGVEALDLTLREPARIGSLRHVEQAATALLWALSDADGV